MTVRLVGGVSVVAPLRTITLRVRCTPAEAERLRAGAVAAGVSLSEWLRARADGPACVCGPDHDCRANGCDDSCPACS